MRLSAYHGPQGWRFIDGYVFRRVDAAKHFGTEYVGKNQFPA